MPVPASDAIASDVGHGALGVRYGLRPFRDLLSETVGQRHLWVELRPKRDFAVWTSEGSGLYSKAVAQTFDGVTLDVVGVQTLTETLARVESISLCTAGRFYYSGATLYIHLTGDANPSGTSVVAEMGIHVGSHGVYQPILGTERLTNGTFEAWTGSDPDNWGVTEYASEGYVDIDKTTSDPLQGTYAARFTFTTAIGYGYMVQDLTTLVAGVTYRLSGAYRASAGLVVSAKVYDGSSAYLCPDGRTETEEEDPLFTDAGTGEWRRFTFDFICPAWSTVRIYVRCGNVSGPVTGTGDFDDLKLQPIFRSAYYEPLLSIESLPTIEAARSDSFWGQMSSAIGGLSIANAGGRFEAALAAYDWLGAEAIFRVGGRYQLGGNEILIDDCPVIG